MDDATDVSEGVHIRHCVFLQVDYGVRTDQCSGGIQTIANTHISSYLYGVKMANSLASFTGNLLFKRSDAIAGQDYVGMWLSGRCNQVIGNQFLNQADPATGGLATAIQVVDNATLANTDFNIIHDNVIITGSAGDAFDVTITLGSGVINSSVRDNVVTAGSPHIENFGTNNAIKAWSGQNAPTKASAAALTIQAGHDLIFVSGTADITSIVATYAGHIATLIFTGSAAGTGVTDGSNLKLAGNFVYTADDTITLACDGTNWYERSRSVN
jgi:hypothetical protein